MARNGYFGDFESFSEEQRQYEIHMEQDYVPDVVPCFKCRTQMYQESLKPEENICSNCNTNSHSP